MRTAARLTGRVWAQLGCGLVMVATVVVAASLPLLTPRTAMFTQVGVPIYRAAPDGWGCHLFGLCRGQDLPVAATPIYRSTDVDERVVVDCALGNYVKLSAPVTGWTARGDVAPTSAPMECYAGQF